LVGARQSGHSRPAQYEGNATLPDGASRREVLHTLGLWPALGLLAWPSSSRAREKHPAPSQSTRIIITQADQREYHRLKNLDLTSASAALKQKEMPVGKIGDLTFGRIMSGSNLISMNMHARDLDYVSRLASHYNTEERIFMTLKKCEELGIDGIVLKNHNFSRFRLSNYWKEWGGQMKWLADVITTDINKFERLLVEHLNLGASAAYVWGGASDIWYHQKKPGNIIKAFEMIKNYGVPAGICAHRLEPIQFCEKEGIKPDFYMKTLHHDRYWSAHPKENRRFSEMYQKDSPDHAKYHDNMFCHEHEKTVEFMQNVQAPWIAFKVLAAGAIPPRDGIQYAFQSGADFICLGMFDFQVEEDVEIARKAIAQAQNRKRTWA
jgi:hypothetical protein